MRLVPSFVEPNAKAAWDNDFSIVGKPETIPIPDVHPHCTHSIVPLDEVRAVEKLTSGVARHLLRKRWCTQN